MRPNDVAFVRQRAERRVKCGKPNCACAEPDEAAAEGGKKGGLKTILGAEIAGEPEAFIVPGAVDDWDIEAIESAARDHALALASRAEGQRFNADPSDYQGPEVDCDCGHTARYRERRRKCFETVLGRLHLERAYYHCPACGHCHCPRDRLLGLDGRGLSPGLVRMIGQVGARVSFAEGSVRMR